jgi:hypothetical protein
VAAFCIGGVDGAQCQVPADVAAGDGERRVLRKVDGEARMLRHEKHLRKQVHVHVDEGRAFDVRDAVGHRLLQGLERIEVAVVDADEQRRGQADLLLFRQLDLLGDGRDVDGRAIQPQVGEREAVHGERLGGGHVETDGEVHFVGGEPAQADLGHLDGHRGRRGIGRNVGRLGEDALRQRRGSEQHQAGDGEQRRTASHRRSFQRDYFTP